MKQMKELFRSCEEIGIIELGITFVATDDKREAAISAHRSEGHRERGRTEQGDKNTVNSAAFD
jgi:hypothetical protein